MPKNATEREAGIRASWYVLVTSATGNSVFATMGPYPPKAEQRTPRTVPESCTTVSGGPGTARKGSGRPGAAP